MSTPDAESTRIISPLIKRAASLARKTTALAISSAWQDTGLASLPTRASVNRSTPSVASTEPGLDRGIAAEDHIPVVATMHWQVQGSHRKGKAIPDLDKLKDEAAKVRFRQLLELAPPVPWATDVNDHCATVTDVIHEAALQAFGTQNRKARRLTRRVLQSVREGVTEEATPGKLFAHAKQVTEGDLSDVLSTAAQADARVAEARADLTAHAGRFLAWHAPPLEYAMAISAFLGVTAPLVAEIAEANRSEFLAGLAKASKDHTANGEYDEQWKKYKTMLRLGGRKAKFKAGVPLRIGQNGQVLTTSTDIADDELAYFAKTQAGVITCVEAATARYNEHSKDQFFSGELDMEVVMPMLACRTQLATAHAGTKGGPDGILNGVLRAGPQECADILHPLFVKAAVQLREPLAFKGGDMVGIPKGKGDERTLAAHREILLNNVFGKHHHKYMRSVLNSILGQVLEDVQTGGRPKRGRIWQCWQRGSSWTGRRQRARPT